MIPMPWWVLYVVTAGLGMVWAASEIIAAFEATPIRALFTRGAVLLMLTNAFFACLALLAVLQVSPSAGDTLLTAFAVGFGWQALVRSQINVFRPLPGQPEGQSLVVPVDEVYGRIQSFVRRSIDQSLARDRTKLLEQALALDVEILEQQVQLMSYGLAEMDPQEVQNWMQQMEGRQMTDTQRKMLLASKLIEASGAQGFSQFIQAEVAQAEQQATSDSTPAPPAPDGAGPDAGEIQDSQEAEASPAEEPSS